MQNFQSYKQKRMAQDPEFWKDYQKRYEIFKLGILLKHAREKSGFTQDQMAEKIQLSKKLISKMENDAPDVRLSHLEKFAEAVGRRLYVVLE